MSATARLAHYVVAPKLTLEQPGMTLPPETLIPYAMGYGVPYAQYSPKIVDPPAGSDLIEEWEFFYRLAQQMGLSLAVESAFAWGPDVAAPARTELDMQNQPSTDDLFEYLTKGSRVALSDVKAHPEGHIFPDPPIFIEERDADCDARLDLANSVMLRELAEVAAEPSEDDTEFAFRLLCRRLPDVHNSAGRDIPKLTRKYSYNPAFMNPEDLRELGLASGDAVEIASGHATILGVVEAEEELRRGVVSMPHAFGDVPERDAELRTIGSNTGRLTSVASDYDPYTGIPRMSDIPVNVRRYQGTLAS
jgi:anaerobic selenocysteine-containing dehydrogenase